MKYTPELEDALVRRLNDGGCPVLHDQGYQIRPVGLAIEGIPGLNFNRIFPLAHGGTGYHIEFMLRNETNHTIKLQGFQIKTPWGFPRISLLPAPRKSSEKYPLYCFPEPGPYYDGAYVMNPLFARHGRLMPDEEIEGSLVFSSEERIPAEIGHLAPIVAMLRIFDSRQNAFSAQFGLRVYRSEVVACENAELRARAKTETPRRDPARSLVAPPTPEGPSEPNWDEIAHDLVDCIAAIKSKHEDFIK